MTLPRTLYFSRCVNPCRTTTTITTNTNSTTQSLSVSRSILRLPLSRTVQYHVNRVSIVTFLLLSLVSTQCKYQSFLSTPSESVCPVVMNFLPVYFSSTGTLINCLSILLWSNNSLVTTYRQKVEFTLKLLLFLTQYYHKYTGWCHMKDLIESTIYFQLTQLLELML